MQHQIHTRQHHVHRGTAGPACCLRPARTWHAPLRQQQLHLSAPHHHPGVDAAQWSPAAARHTTRAAASTETTTGGQVEVQGVRTAPAPSSPGCLGRACTHTASATLLQARATRTSLRRWPGGRWRRRRPCRQGQSTSSASPARPALVRQYAGSWARTAPARREPGHPAHHWPRCTCAGDAGKSTLAARVQQEINRLAGGERLAALLPMGERASERAPLCRRSRAAQERRRNQGQRQQRPARVAVGALTAPCVRARRPPLHNNVPRRRVPLLQARAGRHARPQAGARAARRALHLQRAGVRGGGAARAARGAGARAQL